MRLDDINELRSKKAELARMNISGTGTRKTTEPNQALQRMNCIVTDRAPSSTLCANAVHR
jgi:hypothetical protein